jgi:type III secretion protein J
MATPFESASKGKSDAGLGRASERRLRERRFGDTKALWRMRILVLALALFALAACSVPVEAGLDDVEANRVFVALDHANVGASKDPDPAAEGKWRISVPRDEMARALSILREEGLPRREPPPILDALGKGSLVPSESLEHAQLVAGIAAEMERTLQGIEGVMDARVHLSVPQANPLGDSTPPRGTASVLLEHRGATPPISADSVQRLVAGGVTGMLPTDVVVVMLPHTAPADVPGGDLAHVGPITVARSSAQKLQAALGALVALVAALAALTLVLYSRLSQARAALAEEPPQAPREP